ncbi:pyruvate dehydrogenase complex dihydrolipoamide acetyltransferase [Flavilitoribacter nigricans]|uniref:Acetyltransferase component of pyruvate dehydrogenase complex n=1 Tax=Flavilitoribacter nigricans (strain ATCC 23147 / DSM 23189 / NBRC 102662 / NCIMB 1420 / SS-2) TaxID=1122177 RepID=A0A2D0N9Z3_FLAN2|nr:pyruvate dehydrogenase complex dihydrolipoamide acetyltransferase [Flavilitoribacter nigricans]PHN05342.1 pyruvate dehydrogenase complex dihydrolipoamide acetyltransferase [Flavilitoribacter nigricans DSM 23189 = NBRC 102662]
MAEVIRMPRMSDTMEEGNIIGWLKKEGESVEPGETLAEVETDKATMELDAFVEGTLLHIAVKEGPVPIDGVIAVIGEEGEDWKAAIEAAGDGGGNGAAKSEEPEVEAEEEKSAESSAPAETAPAQEAASASDDKRVKASPLAKTMAKDAGVDINQISGSGDHGRIVKRDVEAYLEKQQSAPQAQPAAPAPAPAPAEKQAKPEAPAVAPFTYATGEAQYEDTPVSQMRKVIARRLGESKFTAPHFYLTVEINMDKAVSMRKSVNEIAPTKISFNDFVVKASAAALRLHPAINSSWMGDTIRQNKDVNIGVAVAVPDGLLVPVIRYADMKTLSQINTEVKTLAGKAKDRKLQPDEMSGNTFTISNLGMFGIEEFTAIINPPDSCIMAVGGIIQKPIVKDGEIVVGNMMKVTLSCDHRVVDGATGAQFLNTFKEILENPIRLMV